MKILVILSLLMGAFGAQAANINAIIDDLFCGEMDPFVVGDICLIALTKEDGKKLALVVDMDEFYNQYDHYDLGEGMEVVIDGAYLEKIYNTDVLDVLKDFDSNYFYMNAVKLELTIVDEAVTSAKRMAKFIGLTNGHFYASRLPEGYRASQVEKPSLTRNLVTYLKAATHFKMGQWSQFVLDSGEFDHLSTDERIEVSKNPRDELDTKYLLEISRVYEIYKGDLFIGYYMEVSDHVQAAIYQDGAWIEMFLDIEMNVLKATDESA